MPEKIIFSIIDFSVNELRPFIRQLNPYFMRCLSLFLYFANSIFGQAEFFITPQMKHKSMLCVVYCHNRV